VRKAGSPTHSLHGRFGTQNAADAARPANASRSVARKSAADASSGSTFMIARHSGRHSHASGAPCCPRRPNHSASDHSRGAPRSVATMPRSARSRAPNGSGSRSSATGIASGTGNPDSDRRATVPFVSREVKHSRRSCWNACSLPMRCSKARIAR
jgi:uncharacterized protein involved in copper resistance